MFPTLEYIHQACHSYLLWAADNLAEFTCGMALLGVVGVIIFVYELYIYPILNSHKSDQ